MAVLIEAISVVVLRTAINRFYVGGWSAFVDDCPNETLCFDDYLARVGFMAPADADAFVTRLANRGIPSNANSQACNFLVVDQVKGPTRSCPWIRVMVYEHDDIKIVCAALANAKDTRLVVPEGWEYDASISKFGRRFEKGHLDDTVKFLGREDGVDLYLDLITGKPAGAARVLVDGAGDKSERLELDDICQEARLLEKLLPIVDETETVRILHRFANELLPRMLDVLKGECKESALAYYTKGLLLRILDGDVEALEQFVKANELEGGNIMTVLELAQCQQRLGNADKALKYAHEAVELDPLRSETWCVLASAENACGHHEEARTAIDEALLLAPDDPACLKLRDQLAGNSFGNE